jgi:hypothetical protein
MSKMPMSPTNKNKKTTTDTSSSVRAIFTVCRALVMTSEEVNGSSVNKVLEGVVEL